MKTLITIAFLASFSLSALAGVIRPKDYTCDEFNAMLEEQGTLYIVHGLLGISRGTIYADERDTRSCARGDVRQMNLRTADGSCTSGYMCITSRSVRADLP